jgi:hypothetical protein
MQRLVNRLGVAAGHQSISRIPAFLGDVEPVLLWISRRQKNAQ